MTFRERIDAKWNNRTLKMDWLGLEQLLRDILDSDETCEYKLLYSREALAAYTGRG